MITLISPVLIWHHTSHCCLNLQFPNDTQHGAYIFFNFIVYWDDIQSSGLWCLPKLPHLDVLFVELIGGALLWTEASHGSVWLRCWFWGLLGGPLVLAKFSCCLWLPWGYLVGATKWSTVSSCAGPGGMWEMPSCEPSHQYGTWIHLAKGTGHWECAATCWLPIRFSHCKSLGWLVHESGEVGSQRICRLRWVVFTRLMQF